MTMLPILAYVAGKYRDPRGAYYVGENIREAREVAIDLWRRGVPTICPHTNTQFFDGAAPDEVWLSGDLVMVERSNLVVTVPGWTESSGATGEVEHAALHGILVFPARSEILYKWINAQHQAAGLYESQKQLWTALSSAEGYGGWKAHYMHDGGKNFRVILDCPNAGPFTVDGTDRAEVIRIALRELKSRTS